MARGTNVALLAVDHVRNADLLRGALVAEHGVAVVETPGERCDFVLVDGRGLARLGPELKRLRQEEWPALLPVLLIVGPRNGHHLPPEVWEVADEVVTTPVRRFDLSLRIRRQLAVRERSLTLARRLDELSRSNVDLEQFAYVAAHELAGPLAVVTGAVETLAARQRDAIEPSFRPLLDAAEMEGNRLQTLIRDLLAFSQAGHQVPRSPVPLGEVLAEALDALSVQIRVSEAQIHVGVLPTVRGDRRQLRMVLTNLIGNAIKYRVDGVPPVIGVDGEVRDGRVVVAVSDNGRGVAADRARAIFEMFERSDSGVVTGHGIGLALCRRIVERHDGRIWVEGRPEGGSIFRIELPAE